MSQTPVAPLAGVRVLDLSRLLPGGYTTQMLADLGADVLKIEEPGSGDYARTMPPFARTVGQAFLAVNRDKRSVALNLKHPAGTRGAAAAGGRRRCAAGDLSPRRDGAPRAGLRDLACAQSAAGRL